MVQTITTIQHDKVYKYFPSPTRLSTTLIFVQLLHLNRNMAESADSVN